MPSGIKSKEGILFHRHHNNCISSNKDRMGVDQGMGQGHSNRHRMFRTSWIRWQDTIGEEIPGTGDLAMFW